MGPLWVGAWLSRFRLSGGAGLVALVYPATQDDVLPAVMSL